MVISYPSASLCYRIAARSDSDRDMAGSFRVKQEAEATHFLTYPQASHELKDGQ